jgi:hypothetical protein
MRGTNPASLPPTPLDADCNDLNAPPPTNNTPSANTFAPRIYYDPYRDSVTQNHPWRITNPDDIGPRLWDELNKGTSVMVYNGHANHFFMGNTEKPGAARSAVVMFGDPDFLNNRDRLFVMLTMTCVSAQFAKPTSSGTVINERFLMDADGGAVAVWGPTGQSEAHSHDKLQEGFFDLMFSQVNKPMRLGELTEAGYIEVLIEAPSNDYVLRTFVLLGDPLTRLTYTQFDKDVFTPIVARPR